MSVDPQAANLYPLLDPEWEAKTRHAGWLVLIPFFGWPMVLGYRKAQIEHFFWPQERAMPEWDGRHLEHCVNGFRAMGVIQLYLLPLWIALSLQVSAAGFRPGIETLIGCAICLAFLAFLNVAFPVLVTLFSLPVGGGPYLERGDAAWMIALFHLIIFLLPAGFLRVSATGRFRSAFQLTRTIPLVVRRFRDYVTAWWYALFMNLPPLPLLPFAPWGMFWGYLSSVALFNQILIDEPSGHGPDRIRGESWLARSLDAPPPGPGVRIWRSPWVIVPLPRRRQSAEG
ncbi:hypothetical protein Poly30_55600 [Planctomycetes bacterium Poly30]|uniref:DUF4013 domain-containing protein n=1 Tax=Saltatorellus ferox TaxID=2528018 RepID=A0A518F105_9BACT|nr:hypothetical protein Poly30_55600 [Planctomycetes bacterium Poly30]